MGQATASKVELGRLAPDLGRTCDDYLVSYREAYATAIRGGESAVDAAAAFSRAHDGLLGALYCAADAAAGKRNPDSRLALVAVGGYGRGRLGLQSDVDVLFLCDDPEDPRVEAVAQGLLYPVWDLGVDIGYAVRGIDETLQLSLEDIRTATTLIDLRWVAGDRTIVEDLSKAARRRVFDPHIDAFLTMLEEDTRRRHERFGDSLCLLEPEVKQGRGGLRDLDIALWAAQARWGGRSDADLVRTGALLQREVQELSAARELLWRVRNHLHLKAGRQQDRLTFEDQEEIATHLGFVDGVVLAVEQFMQAYYRHARVVAETAERMLERARPQRRRSRVTLHDLGDGTALFDGHVTLSETERLSDDPALVFRFYRQVVRRGLPPYAFARDAIARVAVNPQWQEKLRASEEATQLFVELLANRTRASVRRGSIVDELHRVGLVVAMLPELEPLTGRVQHDVYHVYTVDVHMVRAVDRLRELIAGEHTQTMGLASRLIAEAPRRTPLFLAVFLHALGKVHGGDRPERGAQMARKIAERLGLSAMDVEHVAWLIENQRRLYHWATRRDTSDPVVLGEIAEHVGTTERLRDLYLLTLAVLSTTNPTALSAWKARMLEDLYFGLRSLEGRRPTGASRAKAIREEVRVGFVGDKDAAALEAFLREMPDRYILANPVDVIRRHARWVRDEENVVGLHIAPGPSAELTEVALIGSDRPGLLADVAAVFAAHQVAVIDAQIYTREDGRAFDVFLVRRESSRSRAGRTDSSPPPIELEKLTHDLRARLEGEVSAEELLGRVPTEPSWARRHSPDVPTEVGVDNEASERFTVIDVFTRDRVGVLHCIAQTLHELGLTIALSKVNTEGERVADVFYVQTAAGTKLTESVSVSALRKTLRERLTQFHARAS